jgi:hypothetical protein
VSGVAFGSSALELLLLLESSPGSFGGSWVGKGCWAAAEEGLLPDVVEGLGESGAGAVLAGSPGNGNCSEGDDFLLSGVVGAHGFAAGSGFADWSALWPPDWLGAGLGAGHGLAGAVREGVVWAKRKDADNIMPRPRRRNFG